MTEYAKDLPISEEGAEPTLEWLKQNEVSHGEVYTPGVDFLRNLGTPEAKPSLRLPQDGLNQAPQSDSAESDQ